MKEYTFTVNVKWVQYGIEGNNDKEAIEKLKDTFKDEFGFTPCNSEITIEEVTSE